MLRTLPIISFNISYKIPRKEFLSNLVPGKDKFVLPEELLYFFLYDIKSYKTHHGCPLLVSAKQLRAQSEAQPFPDYAPSSFFSGPPMNTSFTTDTPYSSY